MRLKTIESSSLLEKTKFYSQWLLKKRRKKMIHLLKCRLFISLPRILLKSIKLWMNWWKEKKLLQLKLKAILPQRKLDSLKELLKNLCFGSAMKIDDSKWLRLTLILVMSNTPKNTLFKQSLVRRVLSDGLSQIMETLPGLQLQK